VQNMKKIAMSCTGNLSPFFPFLIFRKKQSLSRT